MANNVTLATRRKASPTTPSRLGNEARLEVAGGLNDLLADVFARQLKANNFDGRGRGPHFATSSCGSTSKSPICGRCDLVAGPVHPWVGTSLHSIGDRARLPRLSGNDAEFVDANDMLAELRQGNEAVIESLCHWHHVNDDNHDITTASLLENWTDEAEYRVWLLLEGAC